MICNTSCIIAGAFIFSSVFLRLGSTNKLLMTHYFNYLVKPIKIDICYLLMKEEIFI